VNKAEQDALVGVARLLRRYGLATPALIMIELGQPLGFVGEQILRGFGPLLPLGSWRAAAAALAQEQSAATLLRLLADGAVDSDSPCP
jgi:hypothetical protein